MKLYRFERFLVLAVLAALFLAACQPAAPEPTSPPAAATDPVPAPLETTAPTEAAAPVEPTQAATQPAPAAEATALPDGWQGLEGADLGFSLAYPGVWELCQETQYSWAYCEVLEDPEGMGPPPRLYVSAFPQGYDNSDWEVYNFIPAEKIREYMNLPVGGSLQRDPGAPAQEFFTYTRLPNQTVAGWSALVIENAKVWEAPAGTQERVVLIVTEGATYILGAYYETPEQLALFEQVLGSFQFTP